MVPQMALWSLELVLYFLLVWVPLMDVSKASLSEDLLVYVSAALLVPCLVSPLEYALVSMLEVVSVLDLASESGIESGVDLVNDSECVSDV